MFRVFRVCLTTNPSSQLIAQVNNIVVTKKGSMAIVDENAEVHAISGKVAHDSSKNVKPTITGLRTISNVVGNSKIPRLGNARTSTASVAYSSNILPVAVEDIDSGDSNNVFLSPEYVNDIYRYLRKLEVSSRSFFLILCQVEFIDYL